MKKKKILVDFYRSELVRMEEYCAQHNISHEEFSRVLSKKSSKSKYKLNDPEGMTRYVIKELDVLFNLDTDIKSLPMVGMYSEVEAYYYETEEEMLKRKEASRLKRELNKLVEEKKEIEKDAKLAEIAKNTVKYTVTLDPKAWNDSYKDYVKHAQGVLDHLQNQPEHQEKISQGYSMSVDPARIAKCTEADIEKGTATLTIPYFKK